MAQQVKNLPATQETQETQVRSLGWEAPLEEEMATHSNILPEKSHGQRSLVGYSPEVAKGWIWLSTRTGYQLHYVGEHPRKSLPFGI